jgi:hypothetical protein
MLGRIEAGRDLDVGRLQEGRSGRDIYEGELVTGISAYKADSIG